VRITPKHKLVTYVARDLEPYRGFHEFMRALPRVLDEQPDAQVVVVGGDGVSYGARLPSGCWREIMLEELKGKLDLSRIHFVGKVSYETFRALLQRSDAHVYLTYPFVASWSLREAMAMGCALVGSATAPVEEFITDGETGLLAPFTEPERIADAILELLTNKPLAKRLRAAVRQEAERSLCMASYLADYEKLIARLIKDHSTTEQVLDKQVQTKDQEKDAAVAQASASKPRRARKTVAKTNGAAPPATPVKAPARVRVAVKKVAAAKVAAKTAVVAKSSPSVRKKRRPSV